MRKTMIFLFFICFLFFMYVATFPTKKSVEEQLKPVWQTGDGELEEVVLDVSKKMITTKNITEIWSPSFSNVTLVLDIPLLYQKKIKEYTYVMKNDILSLEIRRLHNAYTMLLSNYGFFSEKNKVAVQGIKIKRIKLTAKKEDIDFLLQNNPEIIRE